MKLSGNSKARHESTLPSIQHKRIKITNVTGHLVRTQRWKGSTTCISEGELTTTRRICPHIDDDDEEIVEAPSTSGDDDDDDEEIAEAFEDFDSARRKMMTLPVHEMDKHIEAMVAALREGKVRRFCC